MYINDGKFSHMPPTQYYPCIMNIYGLGIHIKELFSNISSYFLRLHS